MWYRLQETLVRNYMLCMYYSGDEICCREQLRHDPLTGKTSKPLRLISTGISEAGWRSSYPGVPGVLGFLVFVYEESLGHWVSQSDWEQLWAAETAAKDK